MSPFLPVIIQHAGVVLAGLSNDDWTLAAVDVEFVVCIGFLGFCPNTFNVANTKVVHNTIANNFLMSDIFKLTRCKSKKINWYNKTKKGGRFASALIMK